MSVDTCRWCRAQTTEKVDRGLECCPLTRYHDSCLSRIIARLGICPMCDQSVSVTADITTDREIPAQIVVTFAIPSGVQRVVQHVFRELFGLDEYLKHGSFVDEHLSSKVDSFADWIDYPKGNHAFKDESDWMTSVIVSSDGLYLFTGFREGSIVMWDLLILLRNSTKDKRDQSEKIAKWMAHESSSVSDMDFHECGNRLVSASNDTSIVIWNAHTHRSLHTLSGHTAPVRSVEFNHKGDLIVSGSLDSSVRVWSVNNGDCLNTLLGHSNIVTSVLFFFPIAGDERFVVDEWVVGSIN